MKVKTVKIITSITALLFLSVISSCSEGEQVKTVSLYKRAEGTEEKKEIVQPNTLWFGYDTRLGPKEEVTVYVPFLKYLETATGIRFRIRFTEKHEDTLEHLGKGDIHFALIETLSYALAHEKNKIRYLLSGLNKEGKPFKRSSIFVRSSSEIKDMQQLKGKCFAFGSVMSAHGHLVPRKMLEDEGVTPESLSSYIFTGSYADTVKTVMNMECDAGGIPEVLADRLFSEGKIRVIKVSGTYPGTIIAYNSKVDSGTVEAVKTAFLAFDPAGKHREMLVDWETTGMPLGFSVIGELETEKVTELAEKYGLTEK